MLNKTNFIPGFWFFGWFLLRNNNKKNIFKRIRGQWLFSKNSYEVRFSLFLAQLIHSLTTVADNFPVQDQSGQWHQQGPSLQTMEELL